ncbi:uncharacterized protein LOC103959681 isoform X2 [Pyrus x bretschneideri]|uniref:uncharacterized protein LOC103959681 isoform X2 n=1 Tax=Pyrus x bretschneideri TaxID=225117 RepID=UPI00202FB2BE|nr:uncharacterized protein LOC103959681 isoform X2 [Pyrus x bretschneideri]
MTKSSFMQAHEFEKRRAESHSGIQPSVPLMISHTLSLISEQYEAARALCALNQWQSSRGGTRNSCKSKVEEKLDERRKINIRFGGRYCICNLWWHCLCLLWTTDLIHTFIAGSIMDLGGFNFFSEMVQRRGAESHSGIRPSVLS